MNTSIRALAMVAMIASLAACSKSKDPAPAEMNDKNSAKPAVTDKCVPGSAEVTATSNIKEVPSVQNANYLEFSVSLPNKADCGVSVYSKTIPSTAATQTGFTALQKDAVTVDDVYVSTVGTLNEVYLVQDLRVGAEALKKGKAEQPVGDLYVLAVGENGALTVVSKLYLDQKEMSGPKALELILNKAKETGKSVKEVVVAKSWIPVIGGIDSK